MSTTVWVVILIAAVAITGAVAWRLAGVAWAAAEGARVRQRLSEALRRVGSGAGGGLEGEEGTLLTEALREGWIRRPGPPVEEVRLAAVGRVVAYLRGSVAEPLRRALEAGPGEARLQLEEAVGALQDLEFYARSREASPLRGDLVARTRDAVREFVADSDVAVKERLPASAVPVLADSEGYKDALYLVLHNAAQFGNGTSITVTVLDDGASARVQVRDRGSGFTPEAFRRAMDPFYSTTESGLGLGLAHAREVLEEMGGQIELRNHPEGGAEVEVILPRA